MAPRRIVRQRPLTERIAAFLNPGDFFLWLSEEIITRDWDSADVGTKVGLGASLLFLLARANSGPREDIDDVFGDEASSASLPYVLRLLVFLLGLLSMANAVYAVKRTRNYRLFHAEIDTRPNTLSAHRVRVDESPSSPLKSFAGIFQSGTAEDRAHPDPTQHVWELSVWDPLPVSLRLFCLFSPGHVLVYLMTLPVSRTDAQPSVAVFNCLVIQALLSLQLLLLQSRFEQQAKDNSIIQAQVLSEYNTKYVQPRVNPTVRDVGTQITSYEDKHGDVKAHVYYTTGVPTLLLNRRGTFQTHASSHYAKHVEPETPVAARTSSTFARLFRSPPIPTQQQSGRRSMGDSPSSLDVKHDADSTPTPAPFSTFSESQHRVQHTPPSYRSTGSGPVALPSSQHTSNRGGSTGNSHFGGSLGVYSHVNSPLKKATSMGSLSSAQPDLGGPSVTASPRNSREMAALEQQRKWGGRLASASAQPRHDSSRHEPSRHEDRSARTGSSSSFRNRSVNERFPSRFS